jgi:catechol 2,3-dioxygenase-like lactoylglutathione lyase family enzyme
VPARSAGHPELVAFAQEARDPGRVASFWADLLDRETVTGGGGVLLPGSATQVGLRFTPSAEPAAGPGWAHLHVGTSAGFDQGRTVARALGLGARPLDVGRLPEERHVVLADPEGTAFCVIEPENSWLADCGALGEITCDGSRAVGRFWAGALGWPLVLDQDGQTAIQSPAGGTKIAWDEGQAAPERGRRRSRQTFELRAVAPLEDEAARLVGLGATRHGRHADTVDLADVDGTPFRLDP